MVAVIIIVILMSTSIISLVKAQTLHITKDYDVGVRDNYSWFGQNVTINTKIFSYGVKMSVETEPNGEWVIGNSYEIQWKISLIYLNSDLYKNQSDFYAYFSNPSVEKYGNLKAVINETYMKIGQDGLLTGKCTPDRLLNQAGLRTIFYGNYYFQGEVYPCGWEPPDISINITSPVITTPTVTTPPANVLRDITPFISWTVVLVFSIVTIVLYSKFRKKKELNQHKAQ
jgi:hypothetical protein